MDQRLRLKLEVTIETGIDSEKDGNVGVE
ncbi:hypothetical protein A2U01_0042829, partial [Trifolium medium]|nr:hypothetical protein [Trifolium medium]